MTETKKSSKILKVDKVTADKAKSRVKSRPLDAVRANDTAIEKKVVAGLSAEVFDITGKVIAKIHLPQEIFGAKLNKPLISQAIRVYLANQRIGTASTKTRGQVQGSTRKIYRQKGTGRARHGSIRAPIFVHGGIVGGPKPRNYKLSLPQKMKKAALFSALSDKFKSSQVKIVDGLSLIEPKTKKFIHVIDNLGINSKKRKLLLIIPSEIDNLKRATRNIQGVNVISAKRLNIYNALENTCLLFMKDAIEELSKRFDKNHISQDKNQ